MKYPQLVSMPSAISDWLEEQLETRGIDSEIYTRYILSLLHAHTFYVIYPEDDLPFSRLKQSCEIESLVDELCEKLKVNSGGDDSPNKANLGTKLLNEPPKQRKISPEELTERYLKDFTSLNHREENAYFLSNINLVGGKWLSHNKNQIDLVAANWTASGSPKKSKRKPKRHYYEITMKPSSRTGQSRNRFGHKRTHCGRSLTKEVADSLANWQFIYNNNYQSHDQCWDSLDPTMAAPFSEHVDLCDIDESDSPVCRMKVWLQNTESEKDYGANKDNTVVKRTRVFEKKAKYIPLYPTAIWSDNEDPNVEWTNNFKQFAERPQHCSSEKDSLISWSYEGEESAIREEYQRFVKEEIECAIKEEYDRSHELYREERSIHAGGQWDVHFNETAIQIEGTSSSNVNMLSQIESDVFNFGLAVPDDLQKQNEEFTRENNAKKILEDTNSQPVVATVTCKRCDDDHWWCRDVSKMPLFIDFDALFDKRTISLMMVNHSMENSAFREYNRPVQMNIDGLCPGPFSRPFGRPIKRPRPLLDKTSQKMAVIPPTQMSEEQKRSSPHMYFEPIKTFTNQEESKGGNGTSLEDGTTFNITGTLDEVKFQRTATGSLILATEFGEFRKYFEYNWRPPSDESVKLPTARKPSECKEFNVKYWVSPNDKSVNKMVLETNRIMPEGDHSKLSVKKGMFRDLYAELLCLAGVNKHSCQTFEASPFPPLGHNLVEMGVSVFQELQSCIFTEENEGDEKEGFEEDERCEWTISQSDRGMEMVEQEAPERPDSLCEAGEVVWGYAPKNSDVFCKYCNVKHPWPNDSLKTLDIYWDERTLKDIWGGTEMCNTCPWSAKVPSPLVETTTRLREESKEEAERLLSHLSSLQLSYSARLLEVPFKSDEGPREKKRRHSYMNNDNGMWSFATRLQEDCLISLSTLPTRRSVTL